MRRIDMHVHLVGNGSGGTGCWIRPSRMRQPLHQLLLRQLGLPPALLHGDLDAAYVDKLRALVAASSLDAVVILAHERPYDRNGRLIPDAGSMHVPNDYVLRVASAFPWFLPAVSIHPARPDAMEELERCLEGGAVMMKCLPNCQNIDPRDRRYTRFWERMAEAGLPLLAHTGGEHTLEVLRPELSDPRVLEWPLQCGVTVVAAHCGTKSGLFDPQYFHAFQSMLARHPRLYGDNSALNVPIRGSVIRHCQSGLVLERMLHGSDFPIPVLPIGTLLQGQISWKNFREASAMANPLERDVRVKRAMGFPEEVFTRADSILRKLSK